MAGYIFSINKERLDALANSISSGVYSTIMNIPLKPNWLASHEGTFGDYMTMKEGDNVYFFSDRKIYGIGELVNINGDCKFLNFPNSDLPIDYHFSSLRNKMILNDTPANKQNRMLCTFRGSPYFFKNGVDMDEVLASNPDKFRMLRAFWKLSFIKIDDNENDALIDIILKNNETNLYTKNDIFLESNTLHKRISNLVDSHYKIKSENILANCSDANGPLKHEMALETGILDYISNNKTNIFGPWDYLSHQVIASPFKPIDYMDKMDVFGYRFIPNFQTISKYLVIEIKRDIAGLDVLNQVMKYVDWINQEYSYGDYNMIEAFIVAYDFHDELLKMINKIANRKYIKSRRPPIPMEWANLRLIKYRFNSQLKRLEFTEI